jgi:hypothetical protein
MLNAQIQYIETSDENSGQPYAINLANHLDSIRSTNGGRVAPVYNSHINPVDRHWLNSYYQGIGKNPSIAQNGVNLSKNLRRLPSFHIK